MALFLVTQTPKPKYRTGLSTAAVIVEAVSKKAAIKWAVDTFGNDSDRWFAPSPEYCQPRAEVLNPGVVFCL